VLATGLANNLTQVVFRQPFVIQHVRTRLLDCETWNFWCFYIFIDAKSICDPWCYCISSCCNRVISWFESQKCMNKPHHAISSLFYLSQLVFWFIRLVLSLLAFSALALEFRLFTLKYCSQISGLKKFADRFNFVAYVENSYLSW